MLCMFYHKLKIQQINPTRKMAKDVYRIFTDKERK